MFHKCFRNMFGNVGRPPKKFSNKKGILVQYLAHWVISPKNILEEIVWVVFAKTTTNILFGEMNTSQQTMIESIFWEIYMIYKNISHKYFWTSLWANIFLKQLFKRYHSPKNNQKIFWEMHLSFFCKYLPKVSQGIFRAISSKLFLGNLRREMSPNMFLETYCVRYHPNFFTSYSWGISATNYPEEVCWVIFPKKILEDIFWVRAKNTSVFCEISRKRRVNYIILWEISRKKSFWKTDFGDDSPQQKSIFLVGCPLQGSLKNIFSVRSVFKAYLAKYLLEDAWEILSREVSSVFTPKKVFSLNSNRCAGPCIKGLGGTQHPRSPNSAQINSSLVWPRILLKHRKLLLGLPGIYTP